MSAITPLATSTPLPIAGIASPCRYETLIELAAPAVVWVTVGPERVGAAVAEPALRPPIVLIVIPEVDNAKVLPTLEELV
jgi:hypothetical protein